MLWEETIIGPICCQSAGRHQQQIELLHLLSTSRAKAVEENLAPRKSNRVLTLTLVLARVWLSVLRRVQLLVDSVRMGFREQEISGTDIFQAEKPLVCKTKFGLTVCISGSVPRELAEMWWLSPSWWFIGTQTTWSIRSVPPLLYS